MKKVAIPITKDNKIEDHFGKCEYYSIYTISDENEIINTQTLKSEQGCGCKSNIANDLSNDGVSMMLAGGIGAGAIYVLSNSGIHVIRGCSGTPEEIIEQFVNGNIQDSGESCIQHDHHAHDENHQHEDGHQCSH